MVFGECFTALVEHIRGEESDPVDRNAFAIVFGETLHALMVRAQKG